MTWHMNVSHGSVPLCQKIMTWTADMDDRETECRSGFGRVVVLQAISFLDERFQRSQASELCDFVDRGRVLLENASHNPLCMDVAYHA